MLHESDQAAPVRVMMRDGVKVNETITPKAGDCRVEEVGKGGRMRWVSKRKPQHITLGK